MASRFSEDEQRTRLDALEAESLSHEILHHPFLERMRRHEITRDDYLVWLKEQYFFSRQFPRCIAGLYSRIEDDRAGRPLMGFLAIESWGSPNPHAHWRLFKETLNAFGVSLEDMRSILPHPATSEFLDHRLGMCLRAPIAQGLGSMTFAHELVNQQIFAAYLEGLRNLPNVPAEAQKYFSTHVEEEPGDYQLLRGVIERVCIEESHLGDVELGTRLILDERYRFFDAMETRIVSRNILAGMRQKRQEFERVT